MHIALLGATGFLGSVFSQQILSRGHQLSAIGRDVCDLSTPDKLQHRLTEISPDVLVNCAGYTGKPNVDACEDDKINCLASNAVLPGLIAEACDQAGMAWGHVSSGCIYTGARDDGSGFTELDPPNFSFRQNNCSFYSGTKALGEEVLDSFDRCYIWRMRIPFSNIDMPRNYFSKVMRYDRLLEVENSLSDLNEFVAAALDCFELNIEFGTYNLTNPGSVTTSEVVALIQQAGLANKEFKFFESESQFMQQVARTPRSSCILDSSKALAAGLHLTPVRESIKRSLRNWVGEKSRGRRDSPEELSNQLADRPAQIFNPNSSRSVAGRTN